MNTSFSVVLEDKDGQVYKKTYAFGESALREVGFERALGQARSPRS